MKPTKKQKVLLDFIDGFVKGNGYSPTYREIMRALDYKSVSTVAKHVDNLIVRGWLIKRDNEARTLEVVSPDAPPPQSEETPEQWLKRKVKVLLAQDGLSDDDKQALERTLELLGLADDETS